MFLRRFAGESPQHEGTKLLVGIDRTELELMAVKRWDAINAMLREFETYLSDRVPKPLELVRAEDSLWTPDECQSNKPDGYPNKLTGVYFYVDVCTQDDIHGRLSEGDCRYSVIRKLGKATTSFYDRVRKAHWKQPGGTGLLFQHRWIDIVPISKDMPFVTVALESFLLGRLRTEMDKQEVPKALRATSAQIFDESDF